MYVAIVSFNSSDKALRIEVGTKDALPNNTVLINLCVYHLIRSVESVGPAAFS